MSWFPIALSYVSPFACAFQIPMGQHFSNTRQFFLDGISTSFYFELQNVNSSIPILCLWRSSCDRSQRRLLEAGFYLDRAARRNRHHRNPDWSFAPGCPEGSRG